KIRSRSIFPSRLPARIERNSCLRLITPTVLQNYRRSSIDYLGRYFGKTDHPANIRVDIVRLASNSLENMAPDPPSAEQPQESVGPLAPPEPTAQAHTPASGRRQAFDDVLRPLTPEDLASPGTQKIILYMLQQTQAENEALSGYV